MSSLKRLASLTQSPMTLSQIEDRIEQDERERQRHYVHFDLRSVRELEAISRLLSGDKEKVNWKRDGF